MKNIFNKLGYISKPALIGTVLGVATVAVGIGIVTNFSGGSSKQAKGFSGAALEQYAGEVSSQAEQQASGYSKEELEASMAAAEAQRSNASVYTLKDAAGKEQFAYNNAGVDGVNADNVQPSAGGTVEGMGAGQNISAAGGGAGIEAAAAERAAKAAEGVEKAEAASQEIAKAQLSTSKTMSGSSVGQGYGASASTRMTQSLPRTADNKAGSASIPQGAAAGLPGANVKAPDAFKSGRAGELGGYNVKAQGDKAGTGGQAFFSTTVAELSNAARYSQAGKKTVYGDSGKGTALAQAAFDGSETAAEGVNISGTNVQKSAGEALQQSANTLGMKPKGDFKSLEKVQGDYEAGAAIKKKIGNEMLLMLGIALAGFITVSILAEAKISFWWAIGAAAVAIGLVVWRMTMVADLIKQYNSLTYKDTGGLGMMSWLPYVVGGGAILAIFSALFSGVRKAAKNWIKKMWEDIKHPFKNFGKKLGKLGKETAKTAVTKTIVDSDIPKGNNPYSNNGGSDGINRT